MKEVTVTEYLEALKIVRQWHAQVETQNGIERLTIGKFLKDFNGLISVRLFNCLSYMVKQYGSEVLIEEVKREDVQRCPNASKKTFEELRSFIREIRIGRIRGYPNSV